MLTSVETGHTQLFSIVCEDSGLIPTDRHGASYIDYIYTFNMTRFSCLDHFILSGTLFDESIMNASVLHDVDNLSDNDPDALHLRINVI